MAASTIIALISAFIVVMVVVPILFTMWMQHKYSGSISGKVALVFTICLIVWYSLFFTQIPKVTRPYFEQNSHQVTECTTRQVFNQ